MYFLVRRDLKMGRGKIAAQVAHAAHELARTMKVSVPYDETSKIVLYVDDLQQLDAFYYVLRAQHNATRIVDGGRTQVAPESVTVAGFGPLEPADWKYFNGLKLVN